MDLYYKEASENTPLISLNFKKGLFIIDGQFTLDEPESFFKPIEKNIKQYIKKPCKNTVLTINLSAINISSSTFL